MSIYQYTKQKLLGHGVKKWPDGDVVFRDKRLFLMFVALERAIRLKDFDLVLHKAHLIETCFYELGMREFELLVYMYVNFTDCTPKMTRVDAMGSGEVRHVKEYRREVSDEEIAIGAWASAMFHHRSKYLFHALGLKRIAKAASKAVTEA